MKKLTTWLTLGYLLLIVSSALYQFIILSIFDLRPDTFFTIVDYFNISIINIGFLFIILLIHLVVFIDVIGIKKQFLLNYVSLIIITILSILLLEIIWKWQLFLIVVIFVMVNVIFIIIKRKSTSRNLLRNCLIFTLFLFIFLVSLYASTKGYLIKNGYSKCDYEFIVDNENIEDVCLITKSSNYFILYKIDKPIVIPTNVVRRINKIEITKATN